MLFIIKPTAACNGACVYCSAHQEDPSELGRMTGEELRFILERIESWISRTRPRRVSLLWHGGEPLLMGAAFYRQVLAHCRGIEERQGLEIQHIMQSNLTLVDDELAGVLRELVANRRIGSSFDPIDGIRLLQDGSSYADRWRAGHDCLLRAGVRVGMVYVVHRRSLGRAREIYHAFKELGLTGGMRFNPIYAAGLARKTADLHISPTQWGEFLVELWEVWNEDGRTLRVDPLRGWDHLAAGRQTHLSCAFSGGCTRRFTGLKRDGTVYSCGRSMDGGLLAFGNLHETPLEELLEVENRRALLNRSEWLRQGECAGCRWWSFCHGGCPNDAHLGHGDPGRRTIWCAGRRLFLDRVFGAQVGADTAPEPEDHEDLFSAPDGEP